LRIPATVSIAQKPAVYPAKKQTAQQQKQDDGECLAWSKQNTGIDPVAASQPAPQKTGPSQRQSNTDPHLTVSCARAVV
jgi:hypothetical protein